MAARIKSIYDIACFGTSFTTKYLSGDWVIALGDALMSRVDRPVKCYNSGKGSQNSQWGLDNVAEKVLAHNPRAVLMEFAINAEITGISRAQEIANLTSLVNQMRARNPLVDITFRTTSPVSAAIQSGRPNLALYRQDVIDLAATLSVRLVDSWPLWPNPMDPAMTYNNDGLHITETFIKSTLLPQLIDFYTPIILAAPDYV